MVAVDDTPGHDSEHWEIETAATLLHETLGAR